MNYFILESFNLLFSILASHSLHLTILPRVSFSLPFHLLDSWTLALLFYHSVSLSLSLFMSKWSQYSFLTDICTLYLFLTHSFIVFTLKKSITTEFIFDLIYSWFAPIQPSNCQWNTIIDRHFRSNTHILSCNWT